MNKSELVSKIGTDAGLTKAQAGEALNAFQSAIADALKDGDKVTLVGFGTFSISLRAARTGRNPQTGKEMQIPEKKIVKFKAGKELSTAVA